MNELEQRHHDYSKDKKLTESDGLPKSLEIRIDNLVIEWAARTRNEEILSKQQIDALIKKLDARLFSNYPMPHPNEGGLAEVKIVTEIAEQIEKSLGRALIPDEDDILQDCFFEYYDKKFKK